MNVEHICVKSGIELDTKIKSIDESKVNHFDIESFNWMRSNCQRQVYFGIYLSYSIQ